MPLGKGGQPRRIVRARALVQLIYDLLEWLPRLGLVRETCQLLDVAQAMEVEHPVGAGAVTDTRPAIRSADPLVVAATEMYSLDG